jgi:hypothetical protein
MRDFDLDKWAIETTKWLATMQHGDRICEQRKECTCGREITLLKLQEQIAILMTEYEKKLPVSPFTDDNT